MATSSDGKSLFIATASGVQVVNVDESQFGSNDADAEIRIRRLRGLGGIDTAALFWGRPGASGTMNFLRSERRPVGTAVLVGERGAPGANAPAAEYTITRRVL